MAFLPQLKKKLEKYTNSSIKTILKICSLQNFSNKEENIESLSSFLANPRNKDQIFQKIPKNIIDDLTDFLLDPLMSCICESEKGGNSVTCPICLKKQHISCMGDLASMENYECIRCQMNQMNPADEIIEYLVPPHLISSDPLMPKTKKFQFSSICRNEVLSGKYKFEIQIRCLKIEPPGYLVSWPKQGQLMINHKTIKEFREISNPLRKRKDMALDISFQLETGENSIALIKKNDSSNYCLAVIKIRRNSYDILLQKMQSCSISKEQSLKLIKSLEESDVCSSSIKLNFKCPY